MKRILLFPIFFILVFTSHAQQIAVKSFRSLSNDLDARTYYPKEDRNGEKAALIKIVTNETGFEFDAGSIGVVTSIQKTGEIWLYIPHGSKALTIKHPKFTLLRNYAYPESIEAGEVYEMVLSTGKVVTTLEEQTIESQWLTITTEPAGADVYINDQPAGKTPYQNELPTGKYTWRVSKELYLSEAGIAELLTGGEKQVMKVKMKPNFGTLSIRTEPEINGEVYINDMQAGKSTPCTVEMVPAGKKTIKVIKEMYQISEKQVTIIPDQNLPLVFTANPTFGTLFISSNPESGAMVSFNGSSTGKTTPCSIEKVPAGEHRISLSLDMYETTSQNITLVTGETKKLTITMNPTFAQVTVTSEPLSDIYVNGQMKTKGTWHGRLTPGVYTFEAKLDKYKTAIEKQTVIIGQPLNINLNPTPKTGNLKIMSTPFEATIKIDGEEVGKTPVTLKNQLIGNYTVELSLPGYETAYEKAIITESQTTEIITSLQNGKQVEINSNPMGAYLFIDNKPAGKTPYSGNLSFGSHTLHLENNGKEVEKSVLVSQGGKSDFSIDFLVNISNFVETSFALNIEMVYMKGGTFQMGRTDGENDEKPVHPVKLSDFYIGKTEITQKQWRDVMNEDPSNNKNCDNCPVDQVSWVDVQAYIQKLNQKTGKNYRLPTEAEWEYAARGGNKSKGFIYSGSNTISEIAWYTGNSGSTSRIVGQKKANESGLFDMSGNVWEWCSDWYGNYLSGLQNNPEGVSEGSYRVSRGGGYGGDLLYCRVTNRNLCNRPSTRSKFQGFRLALTP